LNYFSNANTITIIFSECKTYRKVCDSTQEQI